MARVPHCLALHVVRHHRLRRGRGGHSISWGADARLDPRHRLAEGFWRIDQETLAVGDGYINERATLWTPDRRMGALGYQVVGVYA